MSANSLTIFAEHQHVLARVIKWDHVFGAGSLLASPHQEIGSRDRAVVLEVVAAGPGNVSRGMHNPTTIEPSDLVVANLLHRSHELMVLGENVSSFNWEQIMAKIEVDHASKSISLLPLQCYIVTRPNEERAQKIMMGASRIVAPYGDAQSSGGSSYDERGKPRHQMRVACEEVVSVGPGGAVDGVWQVPTNKPGDMVMYDTSVTPVRFMAGGQSLTIMHWRAAILTFREGYDAPVTERSAVN